MAKGSIRNEKERQELLEFQYSKVDNEKMRLLLISMDNKLTKQVRNFIMDCYNSPQLHKLYRDMREGGETKVKSKAGHRQLVSFPNAYVFDFVDTVLSARYGDNWLQNKKALRHELVKPWWTVLKI